MLALDELISNQLRPSPLPLRLQGTSNGVLLPKLLPHPVMAFIHLFVDSDLLKLELCLASLENNDQPLRSYPLVYSGILGKTEVERAVDVSQVEIELKQCPQQQHILAVRVSTRGRQSRNKDTLSLLVLDKQVIGKLQKNKPIHLLKLKTGDPEVYDYLWYPYGSLTLVTLLGDQTIEVWNLDEENFQRPTHVLRVRRLKNNYNVAQDIKFTSMAIINYANNENQNNNDQINFNKYCLFLMNVIGEIVSIFPFLPIGTTLSVDEYDQIFNCEQPRKQHNALCTYLTKCQTDKSEPNEQEQVYRIISTPQVEEHCRVQKWFRNGSLQYRTNQLNKLARELNYYSLKMLPLQGDAVLLFQVVHRQQYQCNAIWLGLIHKQVEIEDSIEADNVYYPLAQIRNDINNKTPDVRFINLEMLAVGSEQKCRSLFYTQAGGLYQLDLSAVFEFMRLNSVKVFEGEDPFPVKTIFRLPTSESIAAMALEQSLSSIFFVRRSQSKIKFEIQPMGYVNVFNDLENITKASQQLLKKINSLRVEPKNSGLTAEEEKKSKLQISPEKLKQYQEKGLEEVKRDYKKYCDSIKHNIDEGMSNLKSNYEIMKKRLKQFNTFKQKRTVLSNLLARAESNNEQINKLLFKGPAASQPRQPIDELGRMEEDINLLRELVQTAKSKRVVIDESTERQMGEKIEELFSEVNDAKKTLESAKRLKRKVEDRKK